MAQYEQTNQLDYRQGGDTVDDFARKYMAETTRIFRFLNDLRSNTTNSVEATEPVAGQLKFEDGKLYCRNQANTAWVLLGTPGSVAQIDANGVIDGSITGNAGKLAGYNVATDNVQDGQVLTYRAATQTWTNENKGVIGTGKALNLYDGSTLLATYNGDTEVTYDLGITANAAYCRGLVDGKASVVQLNTHNSSKDSHSDGLTHPLMDWVASYLYKVGDVRVYNKKIWRCKTANSDAVFDEAKWDLLGGGDYLPLAGGTMTGAIGFDGTTKTLSVAGDDVTWGGKEIKNMSSMSSTSVVLAAEGSALTQTITAPANGYLITGVGNAGSNVLHITDIDLNKVIYRNGNAAGLSQWCTLNVIKGHKYKIETDFYFMGAYFYFAEGEV